MVIFKQKLLIIFFIVTLPIITGCATAPYTERSQVMILPPCIEEELGKQAVEELLQKEKIEENTNFAQLVNNIGNRIAKAIPNSEYTWRFYTINDDETINAFALPGGGVFVYRGILKVAKTEEQLAAIMGHEIAHVLARHGGERMSQLLLVELGGQLSSAAIEACTKSSHAELFEQVYGAIATVGVILPYSRKHEYEADHIGVLLMAEAGYDPHEAIVLWENFATLGNKKFIPEFLSTHPVDENRIKAIESILPDAIIRFENSGGKAGSTPLGEI